MRLTTCTLLLVCFVFALCEHADSYTVFVVFITPEANIKTIAADLNCVHVETAVFNTPTIFGLRCYKDSNNKLRYNGELEHKDIVQAFWQDHNAPIYPR